MTTWMLSLVFVFMSFITTIGGHSHRDKLASMFLIVLILLAGACRQPHTPPPQIQGDTAPAPKSATLIRTEIGFATRQKFFDHYDKHGSEFGAISREQYLRQAQELRDRPLNTGVLEAVRTDGVVTRFDKTTGAFLAFNADLTIRTYFKPNDGEAYFRRQSKRGSNPSSKGGDNE
ncbi:MAG: hypothetical protein JST85_14725 [Acidobacteria bacterium]|nr:hypothetical protein [Acidobacteriota bacterium]